MSGTTQDWWPEQLDLSILDQNARQADPMGEEFWSRIDRSSCSGHQS